MTDRDRLTACGFEVASVPFDGTDGPKYFAARPCHVDGEPKKHFFTIDFDRGVVLRSSCKGATYGRWSIDEACREFAIGVADELSFLDRCRLVGFVRTQPTGGNLPGVVNHWGSLGDGSRWLICQPSEKLIRFDVSPWQTWRLKDLKMVPCSMPAEKPAVIEQEIKSPTKTQAPPRSTEPFEWSPVEHSGANHQEALFA